MPNTKILVVDDDSELREAVTEQLSMHEEFEVTAVGSGREGVQAAKVGRIDLVIMDVGLPDIDGYDAVRILRKTASRRPSSCSLVTTRIPIRFSASSRAPTIT